MSFFNSEFNQISPPPPPEPRSTIWFVPLLAKPFLLWGLLVYTFLFYWTKIAKNLYRNFSKR